MKGDAYIRINNYGYFAYKGIQYDCPIILLYKIIEDEYEFI